MQRGPSASDHDSAVNAGQAVYSPLTLRFYDTWVLGLSNRLVWRCPTHHLRAHYQQHIRSNHLDIGVGTGYFLDKCVFPAQPHISLMDLNASSLAATAKRIARYSPACYQRNVLEPFALENNNETSFNEPCFQSIGMNYLLHCVPGSMDEKAIIFDHACTYLDPGGTLFGSTILQKDVPCSPHSKRLMRIYNKRGIFHNTQDSLASLETTINTRFNVSEVIMIGCVALFWAQEPLI